VASNAAKNALAVSSQLSRSSSIGGGAWTMRSSAGTFLDASSSLPRPRSPGLPDDGRGLHAIASCAGCCVGQPFLVVDHIGWFNHDRLHEAFRDVPPAEWDALYAPWSETRSLSI
jgi:hypothetical protein